MILARIFIVTLFVSCLFAIGMMNVTGDAIGEQLALDAAAAPLQTALR
ncbi:MAG: hypothetical protein AB7O56_13025 [Bauldia sp.]